MFEAPDYNIAHYLDAVAADYLAKGFDPYFLPFSYPVEWLPIALGTTATRQLQIENDADFILAQIVGTVFTGAAAVAAPNLTLELIANASQRLLQDGAVHYLNYVGTGSRPFYLYKPLVLPAKTSLTIRAVNLSGVEYTVRLAFVGTKVYLTPLAPAAR